MARNGSGVYSLPPGSTVSNGDTSKASDVNTPLQDIEADLNAARPIVAGGTGATTAAGALSNLGLTATAAELNLLDGVTATTAELNLLDGVTATTEEINYVDGVTSNIQTQLDVKAPLVTPGAALTIVDTNDLEVAIPTGMNKVDVHILQLSCSTSTATFRGYLGVSGAAVSSTYVGATKYIADGGVIDYAASTNGVYLGQVNTLGKYNATIELRRVGSTNSWMINYNGFTDTTSGAAGENVNWIGSASIELAGDLDYFLFESNRIPDGGTYYATWSK